MTASPHRERGGEPFSRRAGRDSGPSRIPAVTVLLLVLAVMLGVGVSSALSDDGAGASGVTPGLRAAAYAEMNAAGYSRSELQALSAPLPEEVVEVQVPVLMYHYVDDEPPPAGPYADGLTVRTPDFVEQMDYLVENGYHTVRLADVYLAMAGIMDLPEKPVALTFDDGGLDNYTVAFPILKDRGLSATFFVITKTVGAEGQMSWDQLREMTVAGMSVQSHSYSHPDLTGVSDDRLRRELEDSRASVADAVGEPGYAFCYPAGACDDRVVDAVRAAGYVMAVVTDKGEVLDSGAIFEIRRSRVQAHVSLEGFANLVD